jgi:hypothetical protein
MEQGLILEEATFKFSQDANCVDSQNEYEFLEITAQSSLGIDRDNECFFTLRTRKWSVDNSEDFKKIFDRIEQLLLKK